MIKVHSPVILHAPRRTSSLDANLHPLPLRAAKASVSNNRIKTIGQNDKQKEPPTEVKESKVQKSPAQALENCRQHNRYVRIAVRYFRRKWEAQQKTTSAESEISYIECLQPFSLSPCLLCRWSRVWEASIRKERRTKIVMLKQRLGQLLDKWASLPSDDETLVDETMVKIRKVTEEIEELQSEREDIKEMIEVGRMVRWVYERQVEELRRS
ncbi:MAG: hypothetical protein M1820_006010 [Bogoriella megaspora]|nr:MAG: hypothetical protein M1820_006010 [Bogoriella megaspora]